MATLNFANVKGKNAVMCASSCVLFAAQIAMATLFLSGVVDYYGTSVTALGAVELLISIFDIAFGAVFEYLLKCTLGVVYVVATVIIIKNFISSISYFVNAAFVKDEKKVLRKESAFYSLLGCVGSTLKCCFLFMMLCVMTSVDFTISEGGIATLVIGLVCYVGSCVSMYYLRNFKLECILYKAGATAVMLVAYVFLITKLKVASFEQLIYGLRVLFGGYLGSISTAAVLSAISVIAVPILYIILQFCILSYMSDVWGVDFYLMSGFGDGSSGKIMGMTIAITTVNLLLSLVMNNMQALGVTQIYKIIENELPMLIASVALFVCYKFENFEEVRATVKTAASDSENVTEEQATAVSAYNETTKEDSAERSDIVHLQEDAVKELKQYKDLLNSGILTQEEFDAKKKEILGL